jgi:hypothetical protein
MALAAASPSLVSSIDNGFIEVLIASCSFAPTISRRPEFLPLFLHRTPVISGDFVQTRERASGSAAAPR